MIPDIENIIQESLPGEEYFITEINQDANAIIRLTLDHTDGIGIDDIALVSRAVNKKILEVHGEDAEYQLEVSSPGADAPIINPRQLKRHIGRTIEIKQGEAKPYMAELLEVSNDILLVKEKSLPTKQQPKVKYGPEKELVFADLEQVKVVIEFK